MHFIRKTTRLQFTVFPRKVCNTRFGHLYHSITWQWLIQNTIHSTVLHISYNSIGFKLLENFYIICVNRIFEAGFVSDQPTLTHTDVNLVNKTILLSIWKDGIWNNLCAWKPVKAHMLYFMKRNWKPLATVFIIVNCNMLICNMTSNVVNMKVNYLFLIGKFIGIEP